MCARRLRPASGFALVLGAERERRAGARGCARTPLSCESEAPKRVSHGPRCDEVRRDLRRQRRAHPQRGPPRQARGRCRQQGRRCRLGDGRRRSSPGCARPLPPRRARVRRGGRQRRTGHRRPAGDRAAVDGCPARSWQGWRVPILTSNAHGAARILDIKGEEIAKRVAAGEVAVVTGFQGLEPAKNRLSTLGRGGSDTSAVALAVALSADLCDIYTDVDGSIRPTRIVRRAAACRASPTRRCSKWRHSAQKSCRRAPSSSPWSMACACASLQFRGARAMPPVRMDRLDSVGTIVCDEDEIVEQQVVSGIAYAKDARKSRS